ncbi:GntR family transcriptional regulator [Streptomyces sp. DSM 41524]|uniref:GntR family transcriptional regulator n=1 Tax=Streptomyces asiaticus subsp. ignotus TaxID=3098222 RepID=A0ABU7QBY7_9ACTN|nr:GntR family transcriptional regulator [Streptomyces sp. DSM 41524]
MQTPGTITDFVTEEIRTRIVLGALKPGQKVPVYQLAEELGVSRVPLREAVRQLEAESLVDNLPRRGTVVRDLRVEDLQDSFEILQAIEPIAARRAAMAGHEEVARTMDHWLQEMRRLAERQVPEASKERLFAHREFHFALFGAAGNGVLPRHLRMLWYTCERYVLSSSPDPKRFDESAREHADLVETIRDGDPDAAAAVLGRHLEASLSSALRSLEARGVAVNP